jgi:multiple sugar transport system substrate-binding protein
MKKFMFVLLCVSILGLPVFAGGGADKGQSGKTVIKVAYWANSAEQAHFEYLVGGFEKEHPDITVTLQQYPSSEEFWKAIPVAIAAGTGPDVIAFSDEGNAEYMTSGVLAPLDDLFVQTGFTKAKFLDSLWAGWTYNGKIYGVPYDTSTSAIIINRDYLSAAGIANPPSTMAEFKAAAKALTTSAHAGVGIWLMEFHLAQYVHAFGGDWGNGKTIDTPQNAAGLQFVVDLFKEGSAKTPQELGADWDGQAFANGQTAMTTGGPWYVGFLKDAAPNINYAAIPIPTGTKAAQSAYSHGFSITAQSKNQRAAMELIKYMVRDEAQLKGIENVGYAPAVASLLPRYVDSVPQFKTIYDNLPKNGVPFAYPAKTTEFNAALCRGMEEIIFDSRTSLTVPALLKSLQAEFGQ